MREAIDEFVHEIDQNFAFGPHEKRLDFVEGVACPPGWIDEDERERGTYETLYFVNCILKLSAISVDLKPVSRLVEWRNRFPKLNKRFWVTF